MLDAEGLEMNPREVQHPATRASSFGLLFFSLLAPLLLGACSMAAYPTSVDGSGTPEQLVHNLTEELVALPGTGGRARPEAARLARVAVSASLELADKYRVVPIAGLHNTLVNTGLKERGLCWQWMEDFYPRLRKLRLSHYDLVCGVRDLDRFMEHHCVVVVPKGGTFEDGLILDPWVKSGRLVALRVSGAEGRWEYDPRWTDHLRERYPEGWN